MHIRSAAPHDADFLALILLEAFNWDGKARFTLDDMMREPQIAHYVSGWPQAGDFGVVAEDASGVAMGAAWARSFPSDDQGYGYTGPDVPELTLGVLPDFRRRGVARALMRGLIDRAARTGVPRLSLSVEDGNAAVGLYTACGFTTVGRNGGSDTMVLTVGGGRAGEVPGRKT
ncbi:GNAT family N-acetyltransferase [Streptomyces sp. NPDC001985]|uniref:GNAT family N-acetyltransferase n=1 Tax=Streptomyces sp. NPDC001985 TaxID=3154406 RepID=UPI0033268B82